jgi:hypothetical protein
VEPTASPTAIPSKNPTVIPTVSPFAPPSTNINLASLTKTQGFSISGVNTNDYSGWSVSDAGDVNKYSAPICQTKKNLLIGFFS